MKKEDIIDVAYTVIMALACPFALLLQPLPLSSKEVKENESMAVLQSESKTR